MNDSTEWTEEHEEVSSDPEERGFEAARGAAIAACKEAALEAHRRGEDLSLALVCVAAIRRLRLGMTKGVHQ